MLMWIVLASDVACRVQKLHRCCKAAHWYTLRKSPKIDFAFRLLTDFAGDSFTYGLGAIRPRL